MEGGLYLPMSPSKTRKSHTLPNINHSLVSIGELYDAGCIAKFRIKGVTVMLKNKIFLPGWRNHYNKLWYFPLSIYNKYEQVGNNENNLVNHVYKKKTEAELASFLYAKCFSPVE